jgi:hypothetical protein
MIRWREVIVVRGSHRTPACRRGAHRGAQDRRLWAKRTSMMPFSSASAILTVFAALLVNTWDEPMGEEPAGWRGFAQPGH